MSLLDRLRGDAKTVEWIRANLDFPHDWCLIWPFGRTPAGYACFGKPYTAVHRLMCEYRNGLPPTPKHQAAHSCDRGHDGCVNPRHLDWKTNSENQKARYRASGPTRRAKLTPIQVDEIRALKGREPNAIIAARFGVSVRNITNIHNGYLWKSDRRDHRVFSEDEVRFIRSQYHLVPASKLAAEFGVRAGTIGRIQRRTFYKWVTDEPAKKTG